MKHSLGILCRQVPDSWRHYNLAGKTTAKCLDCLFRGVQWMRYNFLSCVVAKCCDGGGGHVSSAWNFWQSHRLESCTLLPCSNLWEIILGCIKIHGKGSRAIWAEPSLTDSEFLSSSCFQEFMEKSWFSCWKQVFVILYHCIRMASYARTSKACRWNKKELYDFTLGWMFSFDGSSVCVIFYVSLKNQVCCH